MSVTAPAIVPTPGSSESTSGESTNDTSIQVDESYMLTTGDRVNVTIANVPEYSAAYQVMVDGCLHLPVIGNVWVRGMTLPAAEAVIASRYATAEILVDPVVNVTLAEFSPLAIVVTGEVNRPGVYRLSLNGGKLPTVTQAIEQAGGITQQTDLRRVEIHRLQPGNPDQILQVSLWTLLTTGDRQQDITLRDGDTIVLPTATAMDATTVNQLATSSLSPATIQVNLVGEVNQPGILQIPPNTPLNQALLLAGGFNDRARRNSVRLLRLNPNGTVSQRTIRIDLAQGVNEDSNPILHNRDVVLIGRSTSVRITDIVGTILSPVNSVLSIINLFSSFFK
jgi:polysaccharide export outer membrane protein